MAINFRSNTVVKNLRVGPLSGGGVGGGGGGGSSEPSYLAVGAVPWNSNRGKVYVYDTSNYSSAPTTLTPSDAIGNHFFGYAISISPTNIAVGAFGDDDQGSNAGAVYVYDASNLSTTPTKLAPTGIGAGAQFGYSVTATSNQIVAGARFDADQGAVYVYDATNLSATPTKLTPSGLDAGDQFGYSVAVTSNHIVAGAYGDDDQADNAGAVYVYDANSLSSTPTKLTPSGLGADDYFGESLAATSNHIVVGARQDDDQGNNAGAVYVYDANNLSSTPTKLTGENAGDMFGWNVKVSGNYIAVSAPLHNTARGAVYVYDATNLSASPTKLTAYDAVDYNQFGRDGLSLQGTSLVVGAGYDDTTGTNSGAVYVFDVNNLSSTPTKIIPSDNSLGDTFGQPVSLG